MRTTLAIEDDVLAAAKELATTERLNEVSKKAILPELSYSYRTQIIFQIRVGGEPAFSSIIGRFHMHL